MQLHISFEVVSSFYLFMGGYLYGGMRFNDNLCLGQRARAAIIIANIIIFST